MVGTDNDQMSPRDIFLKFVEENLNYIIRYFRKSAIDEEALNYLQWRTWLWVRGWMEGGGVRNFR